MSVVVNTQGKAFRLLKKSPQNAAIIEQHSLKTGQLVKFTISLQLRQPKTWSLAWDALAPGLQSKPNNEKAILDIIRAQLSSQKLFAVPDAAFDKAKLAKAMIADDNKGFGSGGSANSERTEDDPVKEDASSKDIASHSAPASTEHKPTDINADQPATVTDDAETGAAGMDDTETRGCPISMVSGEELLTLEDARLPGPIPFNWKRNYRSGHSRDIGLGCGWTHTGSDKITLTDNRVDYFDDEGRCIRFALPVIGQTSRYLPEGLSLVRQSSSCVILKQHGQNDKVFTAVGASGHYRLSQIRHQHYCERTHQGLALALHYNPKGQLTRVEGNWGKALLLTRDDRGHISQIELLNTVRNQRKTLAHYQYNQDQDLIAHKNAKGQGERYRYDNHLLQQRTLVTGFNYYYEWDRNDHKARCLHNWGDDGIYDFHFEWLPEHKCSKATDSRGYTSTFFYNDYGQIVKEIDNEGGEHQYGYHNGKRVLSIDPEGHETAYFFDQENRPLGLRDALDQRASLSYFKGKLSQVNNKDGARSQYEYNNKGQLEAIVDPSGQRTQYFYNNQGLISEVRTPDSRRQHFKWNTHAELECITDSQGHRRELEYDAWGNITASTLRLNNKIAIGTTRYQYDASNNVEHIEHADGSKTHYAYNNNDQLVEHIDPQGRITQFIYDGLSQVVKRIDPAGRSLAYEYDTERNLIALINEKNERYRFIYDGNERLIKEIGFDGREQHYKYNKAGQLTQHLDSGVVITEFERDALGQMLTKVSRAVGDEKQKERTRYRYNAAGKLVEVYNNHQYLAFEYNIYGQVAREHHSDISENNNRIKSSMRDIYYDYQWPGIRSAVRLPDGQKIEYAFNQNQQFSRVDLNGKTITQIEHDELGREVARHQGELVTQSQYDPMGRLAAQQSYNKQQKAQGPIQRAYQYNEFGNLSQLDDGNTSTTYVYDLVNQLKRVESQGQNGSSQELFDFDPAGNLIGIDGSALDKCETNRGLSKGNRLFIQGDRKFSYDARGNLIKENRGKEGKLESLYKYNLQNQLIAVKKRGQVTRYHYDALGRRVTKQDDFGKTEYLWAGDQLLQEQRNEIQKTYVYEPESFRPVAMVQDEEVYHYHLDHLGTPKELSNEAGKVVWKAQYRTYGNLAVKEIEEVENNIRFQGQYFDEETGLHYNRHRYYDPSVGQFITQDPIGLLGGVNNYQYAPNPAHWVDPLGLTCKENSWNAFQKNTKGHFANSSQASKSYHKMKEVEAMSKVDRPDPSTYLPQSYIDTHIQKFNTEGAGFIAIQSWISNPDYPNFPQRKFVGLRSEMDAIISKYESSGNDWRILRDELSLGEDEDLSLDKIAYIVIEPDDPRFSFDIPSGREAGAYDGEWVPGGKTKGGATEASLVSSEKVIHDNSTDNLVKKFPGSKRIK